MKLFGRKKSDSQDSQDNQVPEDLQQYYNSGGSGLGKWLKRVAIGVVVLALLVGGGLFIASKVSKSGDSKQQTAKKEQQERQKKANEDAAKAQQEAQKAQEEAKKKAAEAEKQVAAAQKEAGQSAQQQSSSGATNQNQSQQSTSGASQSQTNAQGSSGTLPNTGPADMSNMLAMFGSAAVIGAITHTFMRRRQLR